MVRIHPILGQSLEYLKLRQLHSRLQSDTSYVQHLGEVLTTVLNNATEEYIVFILGGERPETKELAMTLEAALMTTKNSLHQFAQTLQELLRGKPKDIEEIIQRAEAALRKTREAARPIQVHQAYIQEALDVAPVSFDVFESFLEKQKEFPELKSNEAFYYATGITYRSAFTYLSQLALHQPFFVLNPAFNEAWEKFFARIKETKERGGPIAARRYIQDITAYWATKRPTTMFDLGEKTDHILDHHTLIDAMESQEERRKTHTAIGKLPEQESSWQLFDHLAVILIKMEVEEFGALIQTLHGRIALSDITQLAKRYKPEEALDILRCVAKEPKLVYLAKEALKGTSKPEVYSFVTQHYQRSVQTETGETRFIDALFSLAETRRRLVPIFVSYAEPFLHSSHQAALLAITRSHPEAEPLIAEALEYESIGESEKARILVAIGMDSSVHGKRLTKIRKHLATLSNAVLKGYMPESPDAILLNRATSEEKREEGRSKHPPKCSVHQTWLDLIVEQWPKEAGALRDLYAACRVAGVEQRLRYLVKNCPTAVPQIVADLNYFHQHGLLHVLLNDRELFSAYEAKMVRGNCGTAIEEILKIDPSQSFNAYCTLRSVLLGEAKAPGIEDRRENDAIQQEGEELPIPAASRIRRIVIYGGRFTREKRERLEKLVPVPLMIYDMYDLDKGRGPSTFGSGDVVVWATTICDHVTYYRIKGFCRTYAIPLFHINTDGIHGVNMTIQNFLRE